MDIAWQVFGNHCYAMHPETVHRENQHTRSGQLGHSKHFTVKLQRRLRSRQHRQAKRYD